MCLHGPHSAVVGKGVTVTEGGSCCDQRGSRWNNSSHTYGMKGHSSRSPVSRHVYSTVLTHVEECYKWILSNIIFV